MKKIIYILSLATLLCSCAAEKRLARFLEHHPELLRIDTVVIHDTIILPAETNTITLTTSDIIALDSAANAALTDESDTTSAHLTNVNVSTDRSSAALQALGNGQFNLTTTAKPDTVYKDREVLVPHLVTEYKDREVPVYKQHWWQEGLTWMGALALICIGIWILIFVILKFIKK